MCMYSDQTLVVLALSCAGLEELDNLVELDLTDNLLSKHISLEPFSNLHHLSMVRYVHVYMCPCCASTISKIRMYVHVYMLAQQPSPSLNGKIHTTTCLAQSSNGKRHYHHSQSVWPSYTYSSEASLYNRHLILYP